MAPQKQPAPSALPRGCVQVYTGDGKGKTTAAVGLAVRALGAGLSVYFGQFCKAGEYAEIAALRRLGGRLTVEQFGCDSFIVGPPSAADLQAAAEGLAAAGVALSGGAYDVVILDELMTAVLLRVVGEADVLSLIETRPQHVELVLTGRGACEAIVSRADLVTAMRAIKHYYDQGVPARKGIEH